MQLRRRNRGEWVNFFTVPCFFVSLPSVWVSPHGPVVSVNSQHVRDDVAGEEMCTFSLPSKSLSPMTARFRMLLLSLLYYFPALFSWQLSGLLKVTSAYLSGSRTVVANRVFFFFQLFQNFRCRRTRFFVFTSVRREKVTCFFVDQTNWEEGRWMIVGEGSLAPTQLIVNATALVLWSEQSVSGQVEEEVPKYWWAWSPAPETEGTGFAKGQRTVFFGRVHQQVSAEEPFPTYLCADS